MIRKQTVNLFFTRSGSFDGYCAYVVARRAGRTDRFVALEAEQLLDGLESQFDLLKQTNLAIGSIISFGIYWTPKALRLCEAHCKRVEIFDHHQSTLDQFNGRLPNNVSVDLNKSSAQLAWLYFFNGEPLPALVTYLECMELRRFQKENSREVSDFLSNVLYPWDFREESSNLGEWRLMLDKTMEDFQSTLSAAKTIRHIKYLQLGQAGRKGSIRRWNGFKLYVVNSDTHIVDLAERLLECSPVDVALVWSWNDHRKCFYIHLQSKSVNVAEIAQQWGGGGNARMASFCSSDSHPLWEGSWQERGGYTMVCVVGLIFAFWLGRI